MKKIHLDKENSEVIFGFVFGIIAIIGAIAEMIFSGESAASIAAMVKDISGTMVAIAVFIVAAKNIIPDLQPFSFEKELEHALTDWQKENSTMIVKSTTDDRTNMFGFEMRTDPMNFYREDPSTNDAGWFVRLPLISAENYNREGVEIKFHLNKGTFFKGLPGTEKDLFLQFNTLTNLFTQFINKKYNKNLLRANGSGQLITITFRQPIVTKNDITKLVSVLTSMYQAFLVAANINWAN